MHRRIFSHPILDFKRGKPVKIYFEGKEIQAYEGETVAAALVANGIDVFGESYKRNRPRGFYCAIGKCSSCVMIIDGESNVRTCITPVREGMKVARQHGRGDPQW